MLAQSSDGGTTSGLSDVGFGSIDVTGIPGHLGGHPVGPGGVTTPSVLDVGGQHSAVVDRRTVTRRAAASHALTKLQSTIKAWDSGSSDDEFYDCD